MQYNTHIDRYIPIPIYLQPLVQSSLVQPASQPRSAQRQEPHPPLKEHTTGTGGDNDPGPGVGGLAGRGPEAVLLGPVLVELAQLGRVLGGGGGGLAVAARQPQVRVVGDGPDQGEGVEEARAEEERREREVD